MNFMDRWRSQLQHSVAEFVDLVDDAQAVDLTYGILAAAVLWPVRKPIRDFEGDAIDAVRDITGSNAKYVLRAVQSWDDDRRAAARELADRATEDARLREALTALISHFDAATAFTAEVNGETTEVAEQIKAALVNIGGIVNIQSLHLELTHAIEIPPPPQPDRPPDIPDFVGRAAELAYYGEKLATTNLAVITGMAGIGKTALAARLAGTVATPDDTFWHSFHEREGIDTIVWKLAGFLAWHGQEDLWEMLQSAQQTGGRPPPAETLFDYLFQMVRGRNYLLCFDDFQFVDDDPRLIGLVERLRDAVRAGELRIVITSRRMPDFVKLVDFDALSGLSAADTTHLLDRRGISLTDDQTAELHSHTGGNAQLLTLAIDVLQRHGDPTELLGRLAETRDIERYLMKEVDEGLTREEQDVMAAVAVLLGYPGTRDAIEAVLHGRSVWRTLRRLRDRHMLTVQEGDAGGEYGQHAIVQSFYYELSGRQRRRAMHHRAAVYYDEVEPDVLKAAIHYERAEEYERAAELATSDVRGLINQGQARTLQFLLDRFTAQQLDTEQWVEVKIARGQVHTLLGDPQIARDSYQEALSLVDDLPVTFSIRGRRGEICRGMGELLEREAPQQALKWLKRGLNEVQTDKKLQAAMYIRIGSINMSLGNYDKALRALEYGLTCLPDQPSRLRCAALRNIGAVSYYTGDFARGKAYTERALEISRQLHDQFEMVNILSNLGFYKYSSGDWREAVDNLENATDIAERLGSKNQMATLHGNLGEVYINLGDHKSAQVYLESSLTLARNTNDVLTEVYARLSLTNLWLSTGDYRAAGRQLQKADRGARKIDARGVLGAIHRARAEINLAKGDVKTALDHCNLTLDIARQLGETIERGISLRVFGEALLADGQQKAAMNAFRESLLLLDGEDLYEAARTKVQWGKALMLAGAPNRSNKLLSEARSTLQELDAKRDLQIVDSLFQSATSSPELPSN